MFIRKAAALLIAAAISTSAGAFGLDSLTKIANSASTPKVLIDGQAKVAAEFVASSLLVADAQKDIAQALALKDQVVGLENVQKSLKSGNLTSGTVDKVTTTSKSVTADIQKSLKATKQLTADQKKTLGEGLLKYSLGALGTAKMGHDVKKLSQDYQSELKKADVAGKAVITSDLAPTAALATGLPGHVSNLVKSGQQLIQIATKQGVDISAAKKNLQQAAGFKF